MYFVSLAAFYTVIALTFSAVLCPTRFSLSVASL
nr:MAG TPA: hypothetical protein [Bacteriophage sp.]